MELTAPGGDLNKVKTAIDFGADAVYCGYNLFGLRATATNLDQADLREAIAYAHQHNAKLYLTLNAYLRNADYPALTQFLVWLKDSEIDAVIVSDPGVFDLVRQYTTIPIHISTQSNVTSVAAARFWAERGAKRIVMARELSFSEILEIKNALPELELECFVHGAMCVAYSGRCLLSAYFNQRSANSGACTQVCRWNWALAEEQRPGEYLPIAEDQYGSHILSSKDLCLLEKLPALMQSGIHSGKIEGRMKSEYYVAQICRIYRKAMSTDPADELTWNLLREELEKVSHRPYWQGFYEFDNTDAGIVEKSKDKAYVSNREYCGKVIAHEDGNLVFDSLSKVSIGDSLEIIFPELSNDKTLQVVELYDDDHNPVQCTKPNARFRIPMPDSEVVGGLIRRCVD
jgi:putative protease